ncbi:hypothetical protein ACLOJK_031714 [Asimina triloba]
MTIAISDNMECLQAWPEPIVRAQFLSESGERVIPTTYIKPLSERPAAVDDHGNETKQQVNIPVIDLGSLRGGTGVDRDQAIRMISDACREWGFFQVVNHGLSVELVGRARKVWEDFFQLPLEAKEAYANTPKTYEGYGSRVGVDKGMALDWGDYFFLILTPRSTRNMEKWPSLPSFRREVIEDYCGEMMKVCGMLMGALSRGLGLEEGYMVEAFGGEEMGATLRANYYPKCPQPDLTLGLSAHSDPGSITILLPDDHVNGLQVRKGDSWVTVQAAPNSLVVNVGDQIQFSKMTSNGVDSTKSIHVIVVFPLAQLFYSAFVSIRFTAQLQR